MIRMIRSDEVLALGNSALKLFTVANLRYKLSYQSISQSVNQSVIWSAKHKAHHLVLGLKIV